MAGMRIAGRYYGAHEFASIRTEYLDDGTSAMNFNNWQPRVRELHARHNIIQDDLCICKICTYVGTHRRTTVFNNCTNDNCRANCY